MDKSSGPLSEPAKEAAPAPAPPPENLDGTAAADLVAGGASQGSSDLKKVSEDESGEENDADEEDAGQAEDLEDPDVIPTIGDVKEALGELDSEFDQALGRFSENVWNIASSAVAKTSAAAAATAPKAAPDPRAIAQTVVETTTARSEKLRSGLVSLGSRIRAESKSLESAVAQLADRQVHSGTLEAIAGEAAENVTLQRSVDDQPTPSSPAPGAEPTTIGMISGWFGAAASTLSTSLTVAGNGESVSTGEKKSLSRFEQRVEELKSNADTYLEPVADIEQFQQMCENWDLDQHDDDCRDILDDFPEILELYERVVPKVVEEDTFWMRYFFKLQVLQAEEKRRQALLLQNPAQDEEEEDIGWSDGDDDEELADGPGTDNSKPVAPKLAENSDTSPAETSSVTEAKPEVEAPAANQSAEASNQEDDDDWE